MGAFLTGIFIFVAIYYMPKIEPALFAIATGFFVSDLFGYSEIGIWLGIAVTIVSGYAYYRTYFSVIGRYFDYIISIGWGFLLFYITKTLELGSMLTWSLVGIMCSGVMLFIHSKHRIKNEKIDNLKTQNIQN